MPLPFYTPQKWIEDRLRILLLGAGATGGEVLYALARMHVSLLRLGNPNGLHVTAMDGDRVFDANLGRQRFAECDIGYFKSDILIHRLNLFFGLDWESIPAYWSPRTDSSLHFSRFDLIISCVDRASVRVELARVGAQYPSRLLWMDFGNDAHTGQCVLGHWGNSNEPLPLRLPHVFDLYPHLTSVKDDDAPSCSTAEALRQQDLFVNPLLAEAGMSILWNLLRHGRTTAHGVLIDVREPGVEPLLIGPQYWAAYHYTGARADQDLVGRTRTQRTRRRTLAVSERVRASHAAP